MSGYVKGGGWHVATLLGCFVLVLSAQAAGFDCAKAQTKVEHLICDNSEISKLDEELAASYKAALKKNKAQSEAFKKAQKQWLQRRDECVDVACIKQAYEAQLPFLKSLVLTPLIPVIETYNNDYVRDLDAKTYLPAYVSSQDGEPYQSARDPNVCSLFLQNLQYFARRNIPMSCEMPVASGLEKYIQKVEWEDLDPDQYSELFMERIRKDFASRKKEPTEEYLSQLKRRIRSKELVFRRAKLDLNGYPVFSYPYHEKPAEAKFNLIQYGPNYTDQNNPEPQFRCEVRQGRVIAEGHTPHMYLATGDLHKFYWTPMTFISGQNLWLINGCPYIEAYGEDGTVQLSELRVEAPIHFEPVCLYHYKTNASNTGDKK